MAWQVYYLNSLHRPDVFQADDPRIADALTRELRQALELVRSDGYTPVAIRSAPLVAAVLGAVPDEWSPPEPGLVATFGGVPIRSDPAIVSRVEILLHAAPLGRA